MLINNRNGYRPFAYSWAFDAFKKQTEMHWVPTEVNMTNDLADWHHRLSPKEKLLLIQLFRFFTQGDIDVASGYRKRWGPLFGGHPEVAQMLSAFQNMEAIHVWAYSYLIDTLGLPEAEYEAFMDYSEMREKHEHLSTDGDLYVDLAKYSAFAEGMQLFSSFIILLNFSRFGLMQGMGKIVTWSIKDEQLHVDSMIKLWHTLLRESNLSSEEMNRIHTLVAKEAEIMVELEDKFIDLMWETGEVRGLAKEDVKQYIRYIADIRLKQLGIHPIFYVDKHNLDWVEWIVSGVEHQNFFEGRNTEYAKANFKGNLSALFEGGSSTL